MIRVLNFFIVMTLGFAGPWWLFVIGLTLYGYWYGGYELVGLAFLVDALFMKAEAVIPFYTLGTTLGLMLFEFVKPHLTFYNKK